MKVQEVKTDLIRYSVTQTRCETNIDAVAAYAESYRDGKKLPPLVVFDDGIALWLADGQHRLSAAKKAKLAMVPCEIRQGTKRDALLFSCGANDEHGIKRTAADKRNAVAILLSDKEWSLASDRWIGEICHAGYTLVARLRKELPVRADGAAPAKRKGKDGKERSVPKGRASIAAALAAVKAEEKEDSQEQKEEKEADRQNELKRELTDVSEEKAEAHAKAKAKCLELLAKLGTLFAALELDAELLTPAMAAVRFLGSN